MHTAQGQADLGQEEEQKETTVLVPLKQLLIRPSVEGERVVKLSVSALCFENFENLCSLLFLPGEWKNESSASNKQ